MTTPPPGQKRSMRKKPIIVDEDSVEDDSGLFNVRQASPDGISPAKGQYALGEADGSNVVKQASIGSSILKESHDGRGSEADLSRERRSPENFYPSLDPIETHDVNIELTE